MGRMATSFLLALSVAGVATTASAQPQPARPAATPRLSLIVPPAEDPLSEVRSPLADAGEPQPRRAGGIIAAVEVAPGARLGIGMFGPRQVRGVLDPVGPWRPKTRRAGVGISLKF